MNKIIRLSTVPVSLNILLKGQLKFLNNYFIVHAVSGKGQDLEEVAKREGVKVYSIDMERNISPLKDIVSLIRLYFYFKKVNPLIVHSITPKAGLLSMMAAKMACVPIRIHTFTGLIFPTRKGLIKKILILMDKLLCKCATNIYPEGQGVKNDLINYRITSKKLNIIANGNVNGIDVGYYSKKNISADERIKLKSDLGIIENDFVFVFVGRIVGDKGINELIAAFLLISKKRLKVKLLLVGPEESKDPLQGNTVSTILSHTDIITVGFQEDVRPYLAISNALVFPSYREGFPNVVMQAGAMELPSIVTNINGCNEIIIDNTNGIIVPVKDRTALFIAMEKIINDESLYRMLQINSRIMIESRYCQKLVWESLLKEYKKLEQNV